MPATTPLTFVVTVSNKEVFARNFLASPCLERAADCEILDQADFPSAARAYNEALDRARHEIVVFCHSDIVLPEQWRSELECVLHDLDNRDPNWGVLGAYGNTRDGSGWGQVYSTGLGIVGEPLPACIAVQTLDEIVLILRKSSGLRFDETLPHFHFYGTDICLRAARMGMKSYAIPAFCIHNTHQTLILSKEFYECSRHIRQVWGDCLPIQTSCIRLTRFNVPLYWRRVRELYLRYVRRMEYGAPRASCPLHLLEEVARVR
jgi:glycosyltransferase involved in cell wall biosynthesis